MDEYEEKLKERFKKLTDQAEPINKPNLVAVDEHYEPEEEEYYYETPWYQNKLVLLAMGVAAFLVVATSAIYTQLQELNDITRTQPTQEELAKPTGSLSFCVNDAQGENCKPQTLQIPDIEIIYDKEAK